MESLLKVAVESAIVPEEMRSGNILEARAVYKVFVSGGMGDPRAVLAVRDLNLTVRRGEFLCLVGPSGCGKSTVLNFFAGLEKPTEGELFYNGDPITGVNTKASYITQEDNLLPWRSARGNVELSLELQGVAKEERRGKASHYLARVGLEGFEEHYPHELSGGMRKRVSIVRTLVSDTDVILMDEPFGPIDAQTRLVLQDQLLRLWRRSGRTVIFVTHDVVEAIALADRIGVFTRAPGTVKSIYNVPIPRPRRVFEIHGAPAFEETYDRIWHELSEELDWGDWEGQMDVGGDGAD